LEGIELVSDEDTKVPAPEAPEAAAAAAPAPKSAPAVAAAAAAAPDAAVEGPPYPWLLEPAFAPKKCRSLEHFPSVSAGEEMSDGIRFVYEYLAVAMEHPPERMYAEECVFSVTAEHSECGALAMYREVTTNCIRGSEARLIGREAVCDGLRELFPRGFEGKVMEIHEAELDVGMIVVGFHGVFVADGNGEVLGFDRTFVLQTHCGIMNDHSVVRDPPPWE
jgi:hypothetical protein